MSIATLVLGHSGHGKSASMRNMKKEDVFLIQAWEKPLPFANDWSVKSKENPTGNIWVTKSYNTITEVTKKVAEGGNRKIIIIDDFQYLMADEFMAKSEERGFDKFTEIAKHVYDLILHLSSLPADMRVYILAHIDETPDGFQKMKTIGKLLDEKITPEGLFSIVLKSHKDDKYGFKTQTNGSDTVKSPIGLFDEEFIDNDLAFVDARICDLYKLKQEK